MKSLGDGLGGIFNGIATPLGVLIIILGIAGALGILFSGVFRKI